MTSKTTSDDDDEHHHRAGGGVGTVMLAVPSKKVLRALSFFVVERCDVTFVCFGLERGTLSSFVVRCLFSQSLSLSLSLSLSFCDDDDDDDNNAR